MTEWMILILLFAVLAAGFTGALFLARKFLKGKVPLFHLLTPIFIAAPFLVGVFPLWASALVSCYLMVCFAVYRAPLKIHINIAVLAVVIVPLAGLCNIPFAVDQGMAFLGVVKFLPIPLFALLCAQLTKPEREQLLQLLPLCGFFITIGAEILGRIPCLSPFFFVNDRLAGSFQYPNAFALYLLCGLLWLLQQQELSWKSWGIALVLVFGILRTGSRTTFVLLIVLSFVVLPHRRTKKRGLILWLCMAAGACVLFVAVVLAMGRQDLLQRYFVSPLESSTFLGRLLYLYDALTVIASHPLGLGFSGYYYLQGSFQTGVYSTRFLHNELFQIVIDVGWLPGLLCCAAPIHAFLKQSFSARVLLAAIAAHSMFDFSLQFLALDMILLLLLNWDEGKKEHAILCKPVLLGVLASIALYVGTADALYQCKQYKWSCMIYPFYTDGNIQRLVQAENVEQMAEYARIIQKTNPFVSLTYAALAKEAFEVGDGQKMIAYQKQAIALAPYSKQEYLTYLEMLEVYVQLYQKAGLEESSAYCRQCILAIPDMLQQAENKTSDLGWRIYDKPQLRLSADEKARIERFL